MIDLNLTLIIQLFIILSLVVILSQIVFKPFLGILQERQDRVKGAEERARDLQRRSEESDGTLPGIHRSSPRPRGDDSRKNP